MIIDEANPEIFEDEKLALTSSFNSLRSPAVRRLISMRRRLDMAIREALENTYGDGCIPDLYAYKLANVLNYTEVED